MANHKSAEKRARQIEKITERNRATRSRVRTAVRLAREAKPEEQSKKLNEAFSQIQKAKSVLHKNTIARKMSRLAKSLSKKSA